MKATSQSSRAVLCQLQTTSAVMALAFGQGMAIGWTSPALNKLSGDEGGGPFRPTLQEKTWIVSLFDLGLMVGCWVSAAVFARAGRRQTLLVGPTAMLLWIVLTYLATGPEYLMVARLLSGAGQGVAMTFSYLYVAEVATPGLRGSLILTVAMLQQGGQFVAYGYGPYVSYWVQALLPLPLALLTYLLILTWMQETPFYLAMVGRHAEMLRVLHAVRRGYPEHAIVEEAATIRAAVEKQLADASSWKEAFAPPGTKYAAALVLVVSSSVALVGVTTVLTYTTQIFQACGAPIDPNISSMLVLGTKTALVVVGMPLIEYMGRKLQLALASFGNAFAMGGMCAFMLARDVFDVDVSSATWIPLALMLLYIACTGLGVNTVPQVLMSELLSQRAKAIITPIMMTIVSLTSFGINKYFLIVGEYPGFYVPFGFYACTNLFIALFTVLFIPETTGKSLAQVQEMLSNRKFVSK